VLRHEDIGEGTYRSTEFLTTALVRSECLVSRPSWFTPGKEPLYPMIRRSVGTHIWSGWCGEEKKFYTYRESNSNPSAVQPVSSRCIGSVIPALIIIIIIIILIRLFIYECSLSSLPPPIPKKNFFPVKSGLENRDYGRMWSATLTIRHPSIRKSWH
jgi:hypothetical protein